MKHFRELLFVIIGFVSGIVLIIGCAANIPEAPPPAKETTPPQTSQAEKQPEVTQEPTSPVTEEPVTEEPTVKEQAGDDCETVRKALDVIQAKYAELQKENEGLNTKLNTLLADYDELTDKYNTLLAGVPDISESEVEQAVFDIINKGRQENGLPKLDPAATFYEWAKQHSDYMARKNVVELSTQAYWQDVYRAAGYTSADRIASAAWMVWERNLAFENTFLNSHAKYGTVAATKYGDIFYITFYASSQR